MTALALSGALAFSAGSCAGSGDGGAGGSTNPSSGGTSGGNGGTSGGNGGSSTTSTPTGDGAVTFSSGKGVGTLTGYGWIAMGSLDSASSPKCAPDSTDTTKTQAISAPGTTPGPCPSTGSAVWSKTDALCISGSIPALPASPAQTDYDNNWGLQVGVNTSDPEGTTLGGSYTSIAFTFTGTPTTGLRAEAHLKGDPDGTTYCYDGATSGKALNLTDFNTHCWDGVKCDTTKNATCKALTADTIKTINKVGIQVSSTQTAITVTDLCISGIQLK